jgi:opacity protein-like surface antigen
MRKSITCVALLVVASLSGTTMAHQTKSKVKKQESPQWNVLEIGYTKSNTDIIDDNTLDLDGISIRGTTLLSRNYFLTGAYSIESDVNAIVDIDYSSASAGLGYLYGVSKTADIYATLSYEYVELKGNLLNEAADYTGIYGSEKWRESGVGISVGSRKMLTPYLEVDGEIKHVDLGDVNFTSLRGQVNYYISQRVSVGANYEFSDMHDTIGTSVRYVF